MKTIRHAETRDVPRWRLWLVACACFATPIAMLLLGILFSPFWLAMLVAGLSIPERELGFGDASIWFVVWPMGCAVAGVVGLVGLIRVLTLSRRQRPKRHRVFTIATVAVGLGGLTVFNLPLFDGGPGELWDAIPIALFVVLPFGGAAWLLAKSWKFLLAPRRTASR